MIVAAVSDIHSPLYFSLFLKSVENLNVEPDLFLIGGDVIHRRNVMQTGASKEFQRFYNVLFGRFSCPIVACFGNNEFEQDWDNFRKDYPDIKFLQDESTVFKIKEKSVGIVGSKGSLDVPTYWQSRNIPNIAGIYKERIKTIERLLSELKADVKILLIHYPPTYKILKGERPESYPQLGCNEMERVINEQKPTFVVTGHAHRASKQAWIDTVPVFNVALMLNEKIVVIDTEKLKPGLEKFF